MRRKLYLSLQRLLTHVGEGNLLDDGSELYCLERRQGFVTVLSQDLIREASWPAKSTKSVPLDLVMGARRAVLGAMTDGRDLWRKELSRDNERSTFINATDLTVFLSRHEINLLIPKEKLQLSHVEVEELAREQGLLLHVIW